MNALSSTLPAARFLGITAVLMLSAAGRAAPAAQEAEIDFVAVGGTHALGPSETGSVSLWERHALGIEHLAWDAGLQADRIRFPKLPGGPALLQDTAATLSLEYFDGDEVGAALSLQPGWYYASRFTGAAWDVPVALYSGIPLGGGWSALVGFENARFWHHAMPIAGFVWSRPALRIEATIPEPALTWWIDPRRSLRFGGELDGGGHLSDPQPTRTPIETTSYRVGLTYDAPLGAHLRLKSAAGVEVEREIDAFRGGRDRRGGGGVYLKFALSAQAGSVKLTRP